MPHNTIRGGPNFCARLLIKHFKYLAKGESRVNDSANSLIAIDWSLSSANRETPIYYSSKSKIMPKEKSTCQPYNFLLMETLYIYMIYITFAKI